MTQYISQVHTLVGWEPGRYKDIELGHKTVVSGLNGTGKSRLATSLSLLISGKAPGEVFGKEKAVAAAPELALLYPSGVPEITGTLSGGTVIQPPAAKNAHAWAHPVRAISEALRGSAETAATFFAPFLIPRNVDISTRFPADVVIPGGKAPRNQQELARAIEDAKSTINNTKRQIDDNEVIISRATASVPQSRIDEIEASIRLLESQLADRRAVADRQAMYDNWKIQADWFGPEGQRLAAAHAALGNTYNEILRRNEVRAQTQAQADQLRAWLGTNQSPEAATLAALVGTAPVGPACCPACLTPMDREAWRAWLANRLQEHEAQMGPHRAQLASMDAWLASEGGAIAMLQGNFTLASEAYGRDVAEFNRRKGLFDMIPVPADPRAEVQTTGQTVQEIEDQLRQLRSLHHDAVKASGAAEAPERAQRELLSLQKTKARWDAWLSSLDQVHRWLIEEGVAQFQRAVQAHMPPADGARFRILLERESGAALFRFGMERPDGTIQYVTYGAGRAIILHALAAAILDLLPEREKPQNPVILLDEERSIDPNHLVALMKATAASPYQIVVLSTHQPAAAVEGWTVRDLNQMSDDGTVPEAVMEKRRKDEKKKAREGAPRKGGKNADAPVVPPPPPLSTGTPSAPSTIQPDDPDAMIPPVPDA